jgi:hypothetical protein
MLNDLPKRRVKTASSAECTRGLRSFGCRLLIGCLLASSALAQESPSAARIWNEQALSAIRLTVPHPPRHARNLFHLAAAMWNAWAAFDPAAVGYLHHEKLALPDDEVEAARQVAIHYAAYRLLRARHLEDPEDTGILAALDARMLAVGGSPAVAQLAITEAATPEELGKRCAQTVLDWGAGDGFSQTAYPQAYNSSVNPNLAWPMAVMGTNGRFERNMPLGAGIPPATHPNFWQPLSFSAQFTQNGLPLPGGSQSFLGVQGLAVTPFSLEREDPTKPWLDPFGGPSRLSFGGQQSPTDAVVKSDMLALLIASSHLHSTAVVDISPGRLGNNPLGSDEGGGHPLNHVSGQPYAVNPVRLGDYARVIAEYWADGPQSETPPGHWHQLANAVSDRPELVRRIGGAGAEVDRLEWDVKLYLALSAATHDAACAAWALKRHYSGARPITQIRYMAGKGQSSDPLAPSYHPEGLPLHPGVVEVITTESSEVGGKHEYIWDLAVGLWQRGALHLGKIAVLSWPGEHPSNPLPPAPAIHLQPVRWMLARDWLPFQRKTFNTPAFPGYISGHSTFSHAAAEVLAAFTGSAWFPGGLHEHRVAANTLQMDLGPSQDVVLQWATYADAADQAGQSRRWGGIHAAEDDLHGRIIGHSVGQSAYRLVRSYWDGAVLRDLPAPGLALHPDGAATLTARHPRGMYWKAQHSQDLRQWTDLIETEKSYHFRTGIELTNLPPGSGFFRVALTPDASAAAAD